MATISFGNILEEIDELSLEDQKTLVDILHRRLAERDRRALAVDIAHAREEFAEGRCRSATAEELMKEILS